jgi:23S rRNA pseudouridine2605 synthase
MSFGKALSRVIPIAWLGLLLASLDHAFGLAIPIRQSRRTVVLLYNKPSGVVTTHEETDAKGRVNVYQDVLSMRGFVPSSPSNLNKTLQQLTGVNPTEWNAVGRLDVDTSGLLLITNDGGLVHHVTNKSSKTSLELGPLGKTYEAVIMGYHDDDSIVIRTIREKGVDIGQKYGGQTSPARDIAVLEHPSHKTTKVSLTIYEGKNRQVRRMFHALGSGVMQLQRVSIGASLTLAGLEVGQWRILSDDEVLDNLKWAPRNIDSPKRSSKERTTISILKRSHR